MEALEKKLGIDRNGGAGPSEPVAGKKHRLDDTEYVEESKELVDNVKNAVAASTSQRMTALLLFLTVSLLGFLKKKKKAKTSPPPTEESSATKVAESVSTAASAVTAAASAMSEKVLNAPETAPIALVASAAAGLASA